MSSLSPSPSSSPSHCSPSRRSLKHHRTATTTATAANATTTTTTTATGNILVGHYNRKHGSLVVCAVLTLASLFSHGIEFPHQFGYPIDDLKPVPDIQLIEPTTASTATKAKTKAKTPKSTTASTPSKNTRKRRYYSSLSRDRLPDTTKAGYAQQPPPQLSKTYLDRFIVVPEYKLLFCYIEKVGCSMFNHLFRMLRMVHPELTWDEVNYQANRTWFRNTPQHFNLSKDDLAQLLIHPNWTKAVFFRAPTPRFASAYQSKCVVKEDSGFHCNKAFGRKKRTTPPRNNDNNSTLGGAAHSTNTNRRTSSIVVSMDDALAALSNQTTTTAQVFSDVHFAPQGWFCGGLNHTLQYYDFVHQLRPKTTAYHVRHLFQSLQVPPHISDYLIDSVVRTGGTQKGLDQTFVRQQPHYKQWKRQGLRAAAAAAAAASATSMLSPTQQKPPPNNNNNAKNTTKSSSSNITTTLMVAADTAAPAWSDVILNGGVTQTKAHNTGSNKRHALQDRLHNDNARLQIIHQGYESDYTLFQIPYLTLEELALAGV
jgi:Sulfotransferase family